jgi:deazaflavin-dependent oxidoreductase (nitroreductase family)
MTGAKSGQPRLSPLAYFTIDGKMLLVGSFGGAPKDPPWVQNLRAKPEAHVEVGTESYDVIARELPPDERDALFDKLVELAPMFGDYQAKTSRVIPLFELQKAYSFYVGANSPAPIPSRRSTRRRIRRGWADP